MGTLLLLTAPRAGVEAAAEVLAGAGSVETATASSPADLDALLDRLAGRRLVLAGDDADLHVLIRRLWRRGQLGDVPVGLIPLGGSCRVARRLGLPMEPASAAGAALAGRPRALDLIRSDGGGNIALDSVRLGAPDEGRERQGVRPRGRDGWPVHVNVDDDVLDDGSRRLLAISITADEGFIDVTVQRPTSGVRGIGGKPFRHGRRLRGRAVSICPAPNTSVPLTVDNIAGELRGRRSWWVEAGAWSLICPV